MRYLITIVKYNLVVGLLLTGSIVAQDLEDEGLKITSRGVDTVAEDVAEEALDELISTYNVSKITYSNNADVDLVDAKKDQLSVVLRKAYYQKLTTPRWASVLAADSWKHSFLKWRYFAQLRNYIADLDSDLTYFKMTRPIAETTSPQVSPAQTPIATSEVEDEPPMEEDQLQENTTDLSTNAVVTSDADQLSSTDDIAVGTPSTIAPDEGIVDEESTVPVALTATPVVNTEETWEQSERKPYAFTTSDLTLSDDIISERDIYLAELAKAVVTDSIDESEMAIASEDTDLNIEALKEEVSKKTTPQETAERDEIVKAPAKKVVVRPTPNKELEVEKNPIVANAATSNNTTPRTTIRTNQTSSAPPVTTTTTQVPKATPVTTISAGRAAQTKGFERRKGSLSWPVMSGVVIDRFGLKEGVGANGLPSRNNGIDMSCPPSTSILSVHSGMVMMVTPQGDENVVTVKHGDYVTAYYNIAAPTVQVGDVVAIGQRIGRLKRGAQDVLFHFEVWLDQDRINPEQWLQPR